MMIGLWQNVVCKNKFHINARIYNKAKIVPGSQFLETDPKDTVYFHVMLGTKGEPGVCIPFSGSREACEAWLDERYYIDYEQFDYIENVVAELKEDASFLEKEVHSKCWEIAVHIKEIVAYLDEIKQPAVAVEVEG